MPDNWCKAWKFKNSGFSVLITGGGKKEKTELHTKFRILEEFRDYGQWIVCEFKRE